MFWIRLRKIFQILKEPRFISALLLGATAGTEHKHVLQNLNCDFVVDVGANRGQFALVARKYFPNAKIVSFEPLKEPAALFRKVFLLDHQVVLHEIAIGPEEMEMTIHVSRADDSSSLLPILARQSYLFPGTGEKEVRIVQVKPLASILRAEDIEKPAFLKMDVQGFEKEALKGCKSLLPSFSYIYVECSFVELYAGQSLAHEVISFLSEFGFTLCGVYNLCYDKKGIAIQGDFLFIQTGIYP
jgi:FkbM family methyltransferase